MYWFFPVDFRKRGDELHPKNRGPPHERRIHSGLESEKNVGGDSDETCEHLGGLPAELSFDFRRLEITNNNNVTMQIHARRARKMKTRSTYASRARDVSLEFMRWKRSLRVMNCITYHYKAFHLYFIVRARRSSGGFWKIDELTTERRGTYRSDASRV